MRFTFVQLAPFVRRWSQFKLTDEDLQWLENQLIDRPDAGAIMSGTGGMRKIRFAPPSLHSGKSGAYRVGYIVINRLERIVLLVIFPKSAQPNLTAAEKSSLKKLIESLDK